MDLYKDWETFTANIDLVPEELDAEKLTSMVAGFLRTREERERLAKEAAAGSQASGESFINSYIPMTAAAMKSYTPYVGINRDIFMSCVEKVRKKAAGALPLDNPDYAVTQYISWLVKNETIRYIVSKGQTNK